MLHQRTRFLPILLVATLIAACGGGDAAAPTSTDASTTAATSAATTVAATDPSTTAPATTLPATTTAAETTTTIPADPVMPLTGMPITDPVLAARPALVVKIDNNNPNARTQTGLNAADIVYEEIVEVGTRFAVVFQSQDSDPVGPIRSGRTQDIDLLGSLNKPLFTWSGGNPNVTNAIRSSDLVELSPTSTRNAGFFRSRDRKAPHNLYASTPAMYLFTPVYAPAPPLQFAYRDEGAAPQGEPNAGVDVKMDSEKVKWTWDAATSSYLRMQGGKPHYDATLGQVNAANVVILEVDYQPSPADRRSPEAQTIGSGYARVFTGGSLVIGIWTRDDRLKPFTLTTPDGAVIELTPGRTWVELAEVGTTTPF